MEKCEQHAVTSYSFCWHVKKQGSAFFSEPSCQERGQIKSAENATYDQFLWKRRPKLTFQLWFIKKRKWK